MSRNDRRKTFVVSGVCCATEEGVMRKRLDATLGPETYAFSLVTSELAVDADVDDQAVLSGLREAGFDGRNVREPELSVSFWSRHAEALALGTAAILAFTGMSLESSFPLAGHALLLSAIIVGGWRIGVKALKALRTRSLDMNVLMSVAVLGALAIDRWDEGAAVILLFSVSLMLESYSTRRTRRAIQSLMALSPVEASVWEDGREAVVPARDVRPGTLILIRPGARLPLDGVVTDGVSEVDEAMITGEALPVTKRMGDQVFAGTMNTRGALTVRVTRGSEDTTFARIIQLIEEAQQKRAPVQNFIDKFAGRYTLAVLAGAAVVAVVPPLAFHEPFAGWFYRALVLLVIACPCALVISTPVTLVSALTSAARRGILIKGGKHIETLAAVRAMAFDKTGTLTEGRPKVTDVVPVDSLSRNEALRIVAAIEHRSEHPLASAILAEATQSDIDWSGIAIEEFEALPGKGVRATIGGTSYYLGNQVLCEQQKYCGEQVAGVLNRLMNEGKTAMVLGVEGRALCVLGVRDRLRGQSRDAIARLRAMGMGPLVLLSGDHEGAVDRLAGEVGMDQSAAGMLPAEKVHAVEELRRVHGSVAMVGDGVNDAPALASSSVGIAMGVGGTDAALETADVVLMSDDLSRLPVLVSLSRKAMTIIHQNIVIALGLKAVFLVLSLAGVATLWMAVLADDGAALIVILNGLRMLGTHTPGQPPFKPEKIEIRE